MEEPKDKNIDQLFHKLFKEHGLEQPSDQFTDNIMNAWLNNATTVEYKPLIGKSGKILIFTVIIVFILLSFLPDTSTAPSYMEFLSKFDLFSGFQFSPEFGIIFFTCSVGAWILMAFDKVLKNLILK